MSNNQSQKPLIIGLMITLIVITALLIYVSRVINDQRRTIANLTTDHINVSPISEDLFETNNQPEQPKTQPKNVVIGLDVATPFVFFEHNKINQESTPVGITVDFINLLAKLNKWNVKFVTSEDIIATDFSISDDVDIVAGALTITPQRERIVDFSFPYYQAHLGILARPQQTNAFFWAIFKILTALVGLIVLLYIVGALVNKLDGDVNIKTNHDGAWWALVTFTTTGYGDIIPKTPKGKMIAAIWMIVSMFLLSAFTGYMASGFVLLQEDNNKNEITLQEAVSDYVPITIENTSADTLLTMLDIQHIKIPDINHVRSVLEQIKTGAFVYDYDILRSERIMSPILYKIKKIVDHTEQYGLIINNSDLREETNIGILTVLNSKEWERILNKWH